MVEVEDRGGRVKTTQRQRVQSCTSLYKAINCPEKLVILHSLLGVANHPLYSRYN
jgi:hypothetical protein